MCSSSAPCQLAHGACLKCWHLSERQLWSTLPRWSQKSHLTSELLPCPSWSSRYKFLTHIPYKLPLALEPILPFTFEFWVLEAGMDFAETKANPFRKRGLFLSRVIYHSVNNPSSSSVHPDGPKRCILKIMTQLCQTGLQHLKH